MDARLRPELIYYFCLISCLALLLDNPGDHVHFERGMIHHLVVFRRLVGRQDELVPVFILERFHEIDETVVGDHPVRDGFPPAYYLGDIQRPGLEAGLPYPFLECGVCPFVGERISVLPFTADNL